MCYVSAHALIIFDTIGGAFFLKEPPPIMGVGGNSAGNVAECPELLNLKSILSLFHTAILIMHHEKSTLSDLPDRLRQFCYGGREKKF